MTYVVDWNIEETLNLRGVQVHSLEENNMSVKQ